MFPSAIATEGQKVAMWCAAWLAMTSCVAYRHPGLRFESLDSVDLQACCVQSLDYSRRIVTRDRRRRYVV